MKTREIKEKYQNGVIGKKEVSAYASAYASVIYKEAANAFYKAIIDHTKDTSSQCFLDMQAKADVAMGVKKQKKELIETREELSNSITALKRAEDVINELAQELIDNNVDLPMGKKSQLKKYIVYNIMTG